MAIFSRRHYIAAAEHLKRIESEQFRNDIAEEFVSLFAEDNAAFDAAEFFCRAELMSWRLCMGGV
ncbi:MAG: hypothetical protein ACREHV_06430 [Rhizomicrobium sp.]